MIDVFVVLHYGIQVMLFLALGLLCYVLLELALTLRISRRIMLRIDCLTDVTRWWDVLKTINLFSRKKSSRCQ